MSPYSVLEIGEYVAAPYAGKLFSGIGADVLKVEPPEGDVARRVGPFYEDDPRPENSGYFAYLNTGKRSVTLDPESDEAPAAIRALIEQEGIDLVIETALREYGVDPEALCEEYTELTVTSISGFGATGPFQEFEAPEIVAAAESGQMNKMGYPEQPPTRVRIKALDYMGGEYAAFSSMAALFTRDNVSGEGQYVDVSSREAGTSSLEFFIPGYSYSGETTQRTGTGYARQGEDQEGFPTIYPAADGHFSAAVNTPDTWKAFCEHILEDPELADDERFNTLDSIIENSLQAREIIEDYTSQHEKWELLEEFQAVGIPSAVTATPEDVAEFEHLKEREFWQDVPLSNGEEVTMPGFAFRLNKETIEMERPPRLGEHNKKVYGEAGFDLERLESAEVI